MKAIECGESRSSSAAGPSGRSMRQKVNCNDAGSPKSSLAGVDQLRGSRAGLDGLLPSEISNRRIKMPFKPLKPDINNAETE
jgi:hypothetical protein